MQSSDNQFSDESGKYLVDVKKGKTRKFVMFKEGVQIDRLIIFKHGSFDHVIRNAKQDGAWGEVYWGVLRGDGMDIRFELSRADGFASPPGTDVRLKEFLREHTGLKFEPTYLIVEEPTAEQDVVADESDSDPSVSLLAEQYVDSEISKIADENAEDMFVRVLKLIHPQVKRALSINTSFRDELQQRVREAQEFGRRREFEHGLEALRRVDELAKKSLSESDLATAIAGTEDSPVAARTGQRSRQQQWESRLAEIQPRFQRALQQATVDTDKLQKVMDYAQTAARQQEFTKAMVGLARLEQMLDTATQ